MQKRGNKSEKLCSEAGSCDNANCVRHMLGNVAHILEVVAERANLHNNAHVEVESFEEVCLKGSENPINLLLGPVDVITDLIHARGPLGKLEDCFPHAGRAFQDRFCEVQDLGGQVFIGRYLM